MGLHEAAIQGNLEAIRRHIEVGSNLDERSPKGGASPLITAATFEQTEVAKALIEAGADVNFRQNDGSTPLHTAAFFCRTDIVVAVLDKGADKNERINVGVTALERASVHAAGRVGECIRILSRLLYSPRTRQHGHRSTRSLWARR